MCANILYRHRRMPSLTTAMLVCPGAVTGKMNPTPKLHSNGTKFKERQRNMNSISRKVLLVCALIAAFTLGVVAVQNKFGQPKSILHVITVKWKEDSTDQQKQAAVDG